MSDTMYMLFTYFYLFSLTIIAGLGCYHACKVIFSSDDEE